VVDVLIILNFIAAANVAILNETFEETVRHKFFPYNFLASSLEIGLVCINLGRLFLQSKAD
jgi:hypothetical protein